MTTKAFIFDLNGTMINDMGFHQKAWYRIVHDELGSPITFEQVKHQMYGKNEELLWRVFPDRHFSHEELEEISQRKEKYYQEAYRPHLSFIDGLAAFLARAKAAGVKLAIGSAAVPGNIAFVLDNLNARQYFPVIVSAADVHTSKPHPEVFLKAAQQLGVEPKDCVVFEDAPKGVESARNAGMKAVVILNLHSEEEFKSYENIIAFVKSYGDEVLEQLFS